ncbi:alpha/beta hydrolase [Echinicola rosea]|uniref:Endo-1,4-beta-xylanase n=1 Tax=Echinicola rosea TaxID=1807691 RepID=A0ABQ1VA50_9BACT|nr:alpha/beta hydrolase-fold protein [Echinicola rosea]GGF45152.1 endo-1,4-beta-xylanase [Echinicola rosea]
MKIKLSLFAGLVSLLASSVSYAQSGKVYDELTLQSTILDGERKYAIYLPPDYETSERSYPVLYLLHGAGDDQTGWVQFGEVLHITDQAINAGKATPMIIVMPDADTGRRGYFNQIDGKWNYEDFFFEEFMPHIEEKYRIKGEKRYRAISGLSMGGGGSMIYTLHHPELFSSSAPLSAYVGPLSLDEMKRRMDTEQYSDQELQSYYENHNALSLIERIPEEDKNAVRWYIDCGDDDFLYEGNSLVHIAMKKHDIPHEFRIRDGGHTWTYWRKSLPLVLQYVTQAFHQY